MFKVLVFLVFQFSFYNAFPLCKSQMSRVQLVEEMNRIIDLMDAMKGGADVKIDSVSFSPARRKLYWNLFWDQIDCLGRILEFKGSSVVKQVKKPSLLKQISIIGLKSGAFTSLFALGFNYIELGDKAMKDVSAIVKGHLEGDACVIMDEVYNHWDDVGEDAQILFKQYLGYFNQTKKCNQEKIYEWQDVLS